MNERVYRFIDVWDGYWKKISLFFLVLGVLLFVAGIYSFAINPPMEEVPKDKSAVVKQSMNTEATVVNETELYSPGQVIKGRSIYTRDSMSDPRVIVETSFSEDKGIVNQELYITVEGTDNDGNLFYSERVKLDSRETQLSESNTVRVKGKINISNLYEKAQIIRNEYHKKGKVTASLEIISKYESPLYKGQISSSVPIKVTPNTYSVGDGKFAKSQSVSTRVSVSKPDRLRYSQTIWIFSLVMFGLSGFSYMAKREADASRTAWEYNIIKYSDWITTGEEPSSKPDHQVHVDSITGLVELSADSNSRVVYVENAGLCYVINDNTYYFTNR